MLTQARVRELFSYREGGELIWRVATNNRVKVGAVAGRLRRDGYRQISVDGRLYFSHRLVFLYHRGYMPENDTDHIDRNPGNNRIENLREVSRSCNMRNAKVRENNTSGVVGVSWFAMRRTWVAQLTAQDKYIRLGYFHDFTEAVAHRLAAEQCLNWEGCHSSTTAYLYIKSKEML